jgi:hypothetical protein
MSITFNKSCNNKNVMTNLKINTIINNNNLKFINKNRINKYNKDQIFHLRLVIQVYMKYYQNTEFCRNKAKLII